MFSLSFDDEPIMNDIPGDDINRLEHRRCQQPHNEFWAEHAALIAHAEP